MKKILALITAIMLAISCMGVSFAEETEAPEVSVTVEAPAAEETPAPVKEETPVVEETPAEKQPEQPAQEASTTEQPVEEQPAVETPVAEQPVEEQPAVEVPAAEQPVEEQPVEEQPVEEQPAEEAPAAEQPVEEQPAEEAPVAEQPVEEQPAEEAPVAEQPVEEQPDEEVPVADQPAVEELAEEEPAEEQPVEEQPAEEASATKQSADEESAEEDPVEEQAGRYAEEDEPNGIEDNVKHFSNGYVFVPAGTKLYKNANGSSVYGVTENGNTVYAENVKETENPEFDWVRLSFTEKGIAVSAYVCLDKVSILGEEAAAKLIKKAKEDKDSIWNGIILLNALVFTVEAETENAPENDSIEGTTEAESIVLAVKEEAEAIEKETENFEPTNEDTDDVKDLATAVQVSETDRISAEQIVVNCDVEDDAQNSFGSEIFENVSAVKKSEDSVVDFSVTENPMLEAEEISPVISEREKTMSAVFAFGSASTETDGELIIVTQPADYVGDIGDIASFTVEATGTGLTYQWKFSTDGGTSWKTSTSTGSKTATLSAEMTEARMKYKYCCVVKDASGATVRTDAVCMEKAAEPLSIKTQPVNYVGMIGDIATFTVEAVGSGLTYQWKYSTNGGTSWKTSTSTGSKTATLSAEMTEARMKYKYCCVINDASGVTVRTDAVCMEMAAEPLSIKVQPVNYVGKIGDIATFTVEAIGSGLTYQWKYSTNGGTSWKTSTSTGSKTATLSAEMTEARMKYKYCCVVKDTSGATVRTDPVCMEMAAEPLSIKTQPVNYVGMIGDIATFTVEAVGSGLTYQWKFSTDGGTSWKTSTSTGSKTATLSVEMTEARMKYKYCCVVKDTSGATVRTDAVCMEMAAEPVSIKTQPVDYIGEIGDLATFTVEAVGTGLTYQWKFSTNGGTSWNTSTSSGNKTATLSVEMTDSRLKYKYRCIVKDASGESIQTDAVCMQKLPDPVSIEVQPVDYTGRIGEMASFIVEAKGSGLTYQWNVRKKGETLWDESGAEGNRTAALNVDMIEETLENEYCCVVTDAYGRIAITDTVCLVVKAEPVELKILTQPKDFYGDMGKTAEFSVEAQGDGLTYSWMYRVKGSSIWNDADMDGHLTDTMTGELTEDRLGYEYACQITDQYDNTVMTDAVCMAEYIFTVTGPEDQFVYSGDDVYLEVDVTATGSEAEDIKYHWYMGYNAEECVEETRCYDSHITVHVDDFEEYMDGVWYCCYVTDAFGNTIASRAAKLLWPYCEEISCELTGMDEATIEVATNVEACLFNVYEETDEGPVWIDRFEDNVIVIRGLELGKHTFSVYCEVDGVEIAGCVMDEPVVVTTTEVDDLVYELYEKNGSMYLAVIAYNGTASTLEVPATVEGYTVNKIGEGAFEGNTTLTAIDLPDAIEVIGARAFKGCSSLKSMN